MKEFSETLWLRVQEELQSFARRICFVDSALSSKVGATSNPSFPLRAYLSLRKGSDSNELAITVDVQVVGDSINIASDICLDDGRIIAHGPSSSICLTANSSDQRAFQEKWVGELKVFLADHEQQVSGVAISELT